ncbi:hypothetical protein MJO28_013130 [Puccinia striiformis f. sp. tritici]|uniref:phosphatidylinositol-3,4,5-trisphosphate 3-phosphatase n=3 Tax=Puccinia striiformis f. sp. tritici TaxID=168172 RepID=A0A0L0VHL2_9BASI|nr:hypothetical protein Pst134EA_024412 [Puccinia striiformis f. sp. tritici]KAI9606878.1 hypothetical protein H4Q26_006422 [Puccinia striiformis f. sp. tritici PST-130]KNE98748.1 hypothetical protein PSTG_07935 [Puccinia striiformis f. sp. tritici PST-78]KAH9453542.1 hypothetical protein Pst134EA_024412 [Puccinia striiformis f. sp. tritici]KAI7940823.1 hypothetical protein MJO28_013108 [Puccinia striiformis f. sp. tritici]KAI7940845.1 hypothetical protein MJO28_013130 [Puccinia striiformis f.
MNFNPIRRLVSGSKSRLKDNQVGVELDLCYLTNKIILMGFPASGIETIYRNSRKQVKRWLEARHGLDYRIYNFCPLTENQYDSAFFNDQVHRFPFPDHHPPPLSMIPLFVSDIASFLDPSSPNMAVIHCKAGKGRSGTMSISYLMTLLTLPDDPILQSSIGKDTSTESIQASIETTPQCPPHDRKPAPKDIRNSTEASPPGLGIVGTNPTTKGALLDFHLSSNESPEVEVFTNKLYLPDRDEGGVIKASSDMSGKEQTQEDSDKTPTVPSSTKRFEQSNTTNTELMAQRISDLLKYHTGRRMNDPNSSRSGVSIPSQKRWIGYWGQILLGRDARLFLDSSFPHPPQFVEIKWIKIRLNHSENYFNLVSFKTKIAVQLSHYKSSYIDSINRAEQKLHKDHLFPRAEFLEPTHTNPELNPAVKEETPASIDIEWEDSSDLVLKFASFGENSSTVSNSVDSSLKNSTSTTSSSSYFDGNSSIGTQSSTTSRRSEAEKERNEDESEEEVNETSMRSERRRRTESEESYCSRLLTPVRIYPNPESASNARDIQKKVRGNQAIQKHGGVKIDATREIQCKFVVGSTGSKHASLMSDLVSLGYLWFIPAFHHNSIDDSNRDSSPFHHHHHQHGEVITHFDQDQIDFCHLNLLSHVQICWQFTP